MINIRQPMRILLADDDSDDTDFFVQALQKTNLNYTFNNVSDGSELMEYLSQCEELPHILFMDLNMPKMQGLEALKVLRNKRKFNRMVIAIYSTSSAKSDMEQSLSSGANCYIVKPADFIKLKDTICHVLTMQWQFHNCDMNIDNFIISI